MSPSTPEAQVSVVLTHKWALVATITFMLVACVNIVHSYLISPTRNVPGPWLARFTRLWEILDLWKGESHLGNIKLHKKYGPIVRVGPNRFSFNNPVDVKTIYSLGSKYGKTEYYEAAGAPGVSNIFSTRSIADHSDRRRKVASLYSMSTLLAYEQAVDKMSTVLMAKLAQFSAEQRSINVPQFMQFYAFNVIGEMTVNENFGMMRREGDSRDTMIKAIHEAISYQAYIGLFPELHPWIAKLGNVLKLGNPGITLLNYTNNAIEKYRHRSVESKKDPRSESFLQKLLSLEQSGKVGKESRNDVIGTNIAAGSDTTAITLSAAFYYLEKYPETLSKLRNEIRKAEQEGQLSDPVSFQEAQKLPYLQAVIKETLRIHPAVGAILARSVPAGGATFSGFFFPEGTQVGANAWSLSYNEDIYGRDARIFRPERWLEPKNATATSLQESMNFAFGADSRVCLGKNISMLEITKVIPQILRKFEFQLVHPEQEWHNSTAWFVKPSYQCLVRELNQ